MQIWNKTLEYTAKKPFLLDPVNFSLSKYAGLSKRKLYNEAFDTLKAVWNKELSERNIVLYDTLNPDKHGDFVNYHSPVMVGEDSIIAIKTSMKDPLSFVIVNPEKKTEKTIYSTGQMYLYTLSYGGGKLVWVENKPDPRWANRTYSVIKIMDLNTNRIRSLSHKSRYLSAAVSPDGKIVAAAENSIDNSNSLVLMSSETGEIIRSETIPENAAIQQPRWDNSGQKITVISLTDNGEGILSYSVGNHTWEVLVEYGKDDLQTALLRNDTLLYVSSASETENVYLKVPGGKTSCITRSKFGINDISLNGNNLLFSNYTASGYNISQSGISDFSDNLEEKSESSTFLIKRFEKYNKSPDSESNKEYKTENYKKYQHLFRFHSWMPFYADLEEVKADPASLRPGITLMSQNQLSTLITTVGYEYSENREHLLHTAIIWKGWYPVLETRIEYGGNAGILTGGETTTLPENPKNGIRSVNRLYLPLKYTSGRFQQYFQPSVTYDYSNNYVYLKEEGKYDYGQGLISGRLFFSNYYRSSMRDIHPRWAQTIDFNYTFAPFSSSIYPDAISVKTSFFLPGILPNNSIKLRFEREKQGEAKFSLNNRISFPRGYKNIISKDLDFMSFDYAFPLAYPDFNISSLLYLKRIRADLFFDHASGTDNLYLKETGTGLALDYRNNSSVTFQSYGFELMADFHILRMPFMISGGIRSSWKDISEKPFTEILFNIELFGMAINKDRYLQSSAY